VVEPLTRARMVLDTEIEALTAVAARLDERLAIAVNLLASRRGKVVVIGIGKSGIVGRKCAATLTSTGTPAVFLHPVEGMHGDLGIVQRGDVAIVISNSGESPEIVEILKALKRLRIPLIALTGKPHSTLAEHAEVVLDAGVPREACPMGLAPTSSTTAALALCDALAVVLLEVAGFTSDDFAERHPSGALGRRLRRVDELMHRGEAIPLVGPDTPMRDVLVEMTSKRLGVAGVAVAQQLRGVITDGDLRRALADHDDFLAHPAEALMTRKPKTITADALAETALAQMEGWAITVLFVTDDAGYVQGVVHLHDLLRGEVR